MMFGVFNLSRLKITVLVCLIISLTSLVSIRADNPSPIGWNLSGGGFCGETYAVFNTTLSPNPGLYAENCQTGKNDFFNATDLGFLLTNKVFPSMINGGIVRLRYGLFSVVTTITFGRSGIELIGSGWGGYVNSVSGVNGVTNGTLLTAKTVSMTMIQATTQSPSVTCPTAISFVGSGCTGGAKLFSLAIENLAMNNGGLTGVTPINLAMTETAPHIVCKDLKIETVNGVVFAVGINLDGDEDSFIDNVWFSTATATDIQWRVNGGNVNIIDSTVTIAAVLGQTVTVTGGTLSEIKLLGDVLSLNMNGVYFANAQPSLDGRINVNGHILYDAALLGGVVSLDPAIPFFAGTGTVSDIGFSGTTWYFFAGTPTWNAGGATLSLQISVGAVPPSTGATTPGTNHVFSGTTPTGFPFTITGGNF